MMLPLFALTVAIAQAPQAPSLAELKNATYTGVYKEPVRLQDGVFEGKPFVADSPTRPRVELASLIVATGTVGAGREPAAAVILMESGGGTGLMHYLALVKREGAAVRNVATVAIGDRVALRALSIKDGAVVLDLIGHGTGEPACCPTQKQRRTWRFEKGTLAEAPALDLGAVSIADLDGQTWSLSSLDRTEPLPDGITVTLQVAAGRVGGKGACNRYNGSLEQGAGPRDIRIHRLLSTMMACQGAAMEMEQRYVKALEAVTDFTFTQGRLSLSYRDGDALRALTFTGGDGGWK
jgi:heat shock protein HslJ